MQSELNNVIEMLELNRIHYACLSVFTICTINGHLNCLLQNGSVVMFGRVASYRFLDSPTDGRYNLALSQSQLDSACLYER